MGFSLFSAKVTSRWRKYEPAEIRSKRGAHTREMPVSACRGGKWKARTEQSGGVSTQGSDGTSQSSRAWSHQTPVGMTVEGIEVAGVSLRLKQVF